jgi:hypothetical protein
MRTRIGAALFFLSGILLSPTCGAQSASDPPTPARAQQPSVAEPVVLKEGTSVLVANVEELSSKTAKPGQRIDFRVLDDVQADGRIVVAKGSEAWGTVREIAAARRMGRTASMTVSVDAASSVTGEEIPLRKSTHLKDPNGLGKATGDAIRDFPYILPLVPLFLLMHGGESVMLRATRVMAVVDKDVPFESAAIARLQPLRPPGPARSGFAFVTLFRQKDGNPASAYVYCGKARIGWADPGKYFRVQLPPGRYRFRSYEKPGFEVELLDGGEYYIRGLSEEGIIRLVPALQGEFELLARDLKPANPRLVKDVSKIDLKKLQDLRK